VTRAIAGFGANSVIHMTGIIDLSADLPVVVEVVDDDEHVARLVPILDEMLTGSALVTMETVRVFRYGRVTPRADVRASSKTLRRARSLRFARRIAAAMNGAASFEKPLGSPPLRSVMRVCPSAIGAKV
jgi:hypothetical protein